MRVSVICTVLNEGEAIRRLMDSLVAQTRQPDEVVIVDGGSRDNTVAVIQEYSRGSGESGATHLSSASHLPLGLPIHVFVEPGANISRGRNVAIRAASGDLIASVDAGVRLEPRWLECLIAPLDAQLANPQSELDDPKSVIRSPKSVVAGFFVPDPQTSFEIAMGATVLPTVEEIKPERFLPSSRSVAYRKAAWEAAGGYPEWLDYCEDLVFDLRLLDVAGPFAWAPDAVAHFRPRSTLRSFFKQYYSYARGDGKADLWRTRHLIRYITYLILLPGFLALAVMQHPLWLLVLSAGFLAYCRTPYRRLRAYLPSLSPGDRLSAALFVPVIRAVGDVAKMLGYPVGWVWRLRHWANSEIHWRRP